MSRENIPKYGGWGEEGGGCLDIVQTFVNYIQKTIPKKLFVTLFESGDKENIL